MGIRYSCDYPDCGKVVEIKKGGDLAKIPEGWMLYNAKWVAQSARFIVCSTDHAEEMRVLNCQRFDIGDLCVGEAHLDIIGQYIGGGRLVGLGGKSMIGNSGVIALAWAPMSDEHQSDLAARGVLYSRQTLDTILKELDKKYVPSSPEQIAIEQLRQVDSETLPLTAARNMVTSLDSLDYAAMLYSDVELVANTLNTLFHKYRGDRNLEDEIYFVADNMCRLNFGENPLIAGAVIVARNVRKWIVQSRGGGTQNIPTRKIGGNKKGRK